MNARGWFFWPLTTDHGQLARSRASSKKTRIGTLKNPRSFLIPIFFATTAGTGVQIPGQTVPAAKPATDEVVELVSTAGRTGLVPRGTPSPTLPTSQAKCR